MRIINEPRTAYIGAAVKSQNVRKISVLVFLEVLVFDNLLYRKKKQRKNVIEVLCFTW